jgi:hypothetical protein
VKTTTDRVLPKPHVAATKETPLTVAGIESTWKSAGVVYTPEVTLLFQHIAADRSARKEFFVACRTPRDYGYVGRVERGYSGKIKLRVQKASLQFVYNRAEKEGLILATPRFVHDFVVRRSKPVFGEQNCLVAMKPLRAYGGKVYIPQIKGILKPDGSVTISVDMVEGDPFRECGSRQAILFLEAISA